MDDNLATGLGSLHLDTAATATPSVPAEVIQHILGFLDPANLSTLTTLLSCQLVSHSFAAASLAPVVWRPLVMARWQRGELKYPTMPLPLKEDQQLVDSLFPGKQPPTDPFLVFGACCKLDSIARAQLQKMVEGTHGRADIMDTLYALGPCVTDELSRQHQSPKDDTHYFWASEATGAIERQIACRTVAQLMREPSSDQGEVLETAMLALSGAATGLYWSPSHVDESMATLLTMVDSTLDYHLKMGEFSPPERTKEELWILGYALFTVFNLHGVRNHKRDARGVMVDSAEIDKWILQTAWAGVESALDDLRDSVTSPSASADTLFDSVTVSHLCYLTLIVMTCRRLRRPGKISIRVFKELTHIYLHWEGRPEEGILIDIAAPLSDVGERARLVTMDTLPSDLHWGSPLELVGKHLQTFPPTPPLAGNVKFSVALIGAVMGGPGQAERALSICRTEFHLEARTIELCILQVLRGALLHQARRTVDEILLFDHQRPTPSPRPGNCTLLYRVGQAVKVGGELGVIVGWAEQSSRQTVAVPRQRRGGRGGSKPPSSLPLHLRSSSFVYRLITLRRPNIDQPLVASERDVRQGQPTSSLLQQATELKTTVPGHFGQDFSDVYLDENGWPRFVLSVEMRARWPEG